MGAPYQDFRALTEQALDYAFAKVPSADPKYRDALLEAYWRLDCYPEVPAVLKALKDKDARVGILSNGSTSMLESAVSTAGLGPVLDDVFSVDEVRKFKTDMSVYEMVTTAWRLYPDKISFQSSNRWDAAAAKQAGFRTVWLNRTGQPDEYRDLAPDLVLPSLDGLIAQS